MKRYRIINEAAAAAMLQEAFPECTLGSYVCSGAQGAVYRCTAADGRQEVVKFMDIQKAAMGSVGRADTALEEAMRLGAENEIHLLTLLAGSSDHTVQLIAEAHDTEHRVYVVRMQMLTPLEEYLRVARRTTPMYRIALRIGFDIALGLQDLQAIGYAHRDLKPENVCALMQENGRVSFLLCDFGSAASLGEIPAFGSRTPPYAPPEADALIPLSDRYDVYSLGILLETLLRREPCPELLRQLIRSCKSPLPEDRPSTGQIRKVLGQLLLTTAGTEVERAEPPRKELRTMQDALSLWAAEGAKAKATLLRFGDSGNLSEGQRNFLHALLAEHRTGRLCALRNAAASGYTLAKHYYGIALLAQARQCKDPRKAETCRKAGQEWLRAAAREKYYPASLALAMYNSGKEYPADYERLRTIAFRCAL